VTKYQRAKEYCNRPHEVVGTGHSKRRVHTNGERIAAQLGSSAEDLGPGEAFLAAADARVLNIRPNTLDGVFTDPPYFDNVQYAELMDFCYVWLRQILKSNISSFAKTSTRNVSELTGNVTLGRGIEDFTDGLSEVFQRIAVALKPGSPLVFTYHHNDPEAYVPLIVAILDAGLLCTATLCSPAEMSASLHINGTGSSTVDSIFVCRKQPASATQPPKKFPDCLYHDIAAIQEAGVRISPGDISCIALGHLSRLAIQELSTTWEMQQAVSERMQAARGALKRLLQGFDLQHAMSRAAPSAPESQLCLTLFS
jgi:adenine-specific DNA methylase